MQYKEKVVPDFRRGENIHCDREIPPLNFKLRHLFIHRISENRHMKYIPNKSENATLLFLVKMTEKRFLFQSIFFFW